MNYLGALLGVNIFEGFGKLEWIYFGVGIVAFITLIITIVVAVKHNKLDNTIKDEPVTATVETTVEPTPEPVAVTTAEAVVAKPVASHTPTAHTVKSVGNATIPVASIGKPVPQSVKEIGRQVNAIANTDWQIRYDKSQAAKLMQSDEVVKNYYDVIKNELMSYKGVRSRLSWKHEAFYKGRVIVAKLKVRGGHLRLLLPLDPNDYVDTKYKVKDLSDTKSHVDTPCGYAIKNDRRSLYAKDLIATVMQTNGVEKTDKEYVQYSADYPYDTTDNLINRKLIKILYSESQGVESGGEYSYEPVVVIAAEEVTNLMSDEEAAESVEESSRLSNKTKTGIVNVDVLSKTFAAGEKVTLDEIKKRVVGFNKKVTYVKVLARGVIDKPLIVEADDYSIDAVKMILLAGGKVIRTKKN